MGIVFVIFRNFGSHFFRHVRNYGSKFLKQNGTSPFKIRLSQPPPHPVGCWLSCCINFFFINSDDFAKVHLIFKRF